jgi:hypothetical protein
MFRCLSTGSEPPDDDRRGRCADRGDRARVREPMAAPELEAAIAHDARRQPDDGPTVEDRIDPGSDPRTWSWRSRASAVSATRTSGRVPPTGCRILHPYPIDPVVHG